MIIEKAMGYSDEQIFNFKLIPEERIRHIGKIDEEPIETSSAEVQIFADSEENRKVLEELHGLRWKKMR